MKKEKRQQISEISYCIDSLQDMVSFLESGNDKPSIVINLYKSIPRREKGINCDFFIEEARENILELFKAQIDKLENELEKLYNK